MSHQTSENAVIETTRNQLTDLDCVETTEIDRSGNDPTIIATVRDAIARETLKSKLNDIISPVYIDIQVT